MSAFSSAGVSALFTAVVVVVVFAGLAVVGVGIEVGVNVGVVSDVATGKTVGVGEVGRGNGTVNVGFSCTNVVDVFDVVGGTFVVADKATVVVADEVVVDPARTGTRVEAGVVVAGFVGDGFVGSGVVVAVGVPTTTEVPTVGIVLTGTAVNGTVVGDAVLVVVVVVVVVVLKLVVVGVESSTTVTGGPTGTTGPPTVWRAVAQAGWDQFGITQEPTLTMTMTMLSVPISDQSRRDIRRLPR